MATIYLFALVGVALMILATMIDNIVSLNKKPVWALASKQQTAPVFTERRVQKLPFVGKDRRVANAQTNQVPLKKAA